jgi:hypothetical protein
MKSVHFGLGFTVGFAALTVGGAAFAQEATATTSTTTTTTTAPVAAPATANPAPAQTGMTLPGATPDVAVGGTDHAQMAGHFGVGYLGTRGLNLPGAGAAIGLVDAPVIGLRYWLDPSMGIDAGLGLRFSGGSDGVQGYNIAILHVGVPLALAGSKHFSFQVIPEANIGYGTTDLGPATGKDFHLDIGARAGGEVQFGFIGIPELGLQAGIGVGINYDHFSVSNGGASGHTLAFGTSVGDNPWQIFTSNIAALYYFD